MGRRVVITGMGIWSCIGRNKEEVVDSLRAGRSGIGVEEARREYGYRSALTVSSSVRNSRECLTAGCASDSRKRRSSPTWRPVRHLTRPGLRRISA